MTNGSLPGHPGTGRASPKSTGGRRTHPHRPVPPGEHPWMLPGRAGAFGAYRVGTSWQPFPWCVVDPVG